MMTNAELADALRRIATEAGPLVCLGCKYEHNYGIHGCDLIARRRSASRAWTSSCVSMETAIHVCTISPAAMMISRASRASDPKIGSGV